MTLRRDSEAREILEPALQFARAMGIPKLEADVLKVQAHIALEGGETEVAARLAIKCLGIAAGFGMRLRVTGALVLMGRVSAVRGEWTTAQSLLHAGIALGHEQGYQLQVESADRELMRIDSWTRGVLGRGRSERTGGG